VTAVVGEISYAWAMNTASLSAVGRVCSSSTVPRLFYFSLTDGTLPAVDLFSFGMIVPELPAGIKKFSKQFDSRFFPSGGGLFFSPEHKSS